MGTQLPFPKRGQSPQFSAHYYCVQMAGCIKMPLGMEVGLSPGDFVLDGDSAPSPKGRSPPIFGPRLVWPNGWMDQDATWYRSRPRRRRYSIRQSPSSPRRGHSSLPPHLFGPCLLWPRSPISFSATAELVLERFQMAAVSFGITLG